MGRVRRLLIFVVCVDLFGWAVCEIVYRARTPAPVRAFQRHRSAFEQVVAAAKDGSFPLRNDGEGYQLTGELWNQDVRYIRWDDGCVWFTFATGPIWPTDIIVYSPRGRKGMPSLDFPTLTDSRYLDENWLYMRSN
jgi:hypothetical protein